jgi:hypothetical protein
VVPSLQLVVEPLGRLVVLSLVWGLEPLGVLVLLNLLWALGPLGMPLVVPQVQAQDSVVVEALEEVMEAFELVEEAAWKVISSSAEEL